MKLDLHHRYKKLLAGDSHGWQGRNSIELQQKKRDQIL